MGWNQEKPGGQKSHFTVPLCAKNHFYLNVIIGLDFNMS